jgi:oxygen-dependent protoporphyrinogen oxidase
MLTSLRGGIGRLAERAAEVLGDVAKLHTSVARISRDAGEFEVRFAESGHGTARSFQSSRARNVVLAVPAYVAVEIVRELAPGAADRLASIDYASIAVVCTAHAWQDVRHDLNGFGYLIPPMERRETLGCLWTSSIFPGSAPDDRVLFRTMIGGSHHPDAVDRSDEELLAIIRRDVFDLLGVEGGPELVRIFRHRRAIPQYGLDHGDVLAAAEAAERAHPGLYFTGSAFRGVAMIDCAVDGFRVADRIIDSASPA